MGTRHPLQILWRQTFQERGMVGEKPRFGRPGISDTGVAKINTPFSNIRKVSESGRCRDEDFIFNHTKVLT